MIMRADAGCSQKLCTSPDGNGGFDCWAGGGGEPLTCRDGYHVSKTGNQVNYQGMRFVEYTCCSEDSEHSSSTSSCRRLWCGSSAGAWALGGSALAVGGVLGVILLAPTLLKGAASSTRVGGASFGMPHNFVQSTLMFVRAHDTEEASVSGAHLGGAAVAPEHVQGGDFGDGQQAANPQHVREHLDGINVARLLASVHIVVGHLYQKGATGDIYFFSWGYTWVPWFFMLSGYVNTHARLHSSRPDNVDPPLMFAWKRLAPIYPAYAVTLLVALIVRCAKAAALGARLPDWWILSSQGLLMQAWVPWLTEDALQSHCWFLSCLVPFWLGFGFLYRRMRTLSVSACCLLLFILYLPPWIYAMVIPAIMGERMDWYSSHKTGQLNNEINYLVVLLKFHPVCYVHVFIFGMVLSVLRFQLKQRPDLLSTWPMRCGAVLGYLGLLLVFLVPAIRPLGHKLSARLSVLMPLQGLILLGLSPCSTNGGSGVAEEGDSGGGASNANQTEEQLETGRTPALSPSVHQTASGLQGPALHLVQGDAYQVPRVFSCSAADVWRLLV